MKNDNFHSDKLSKQGRLGVLSLLERQTGNVGIELGVAAGEFSAMLLESGRFERLYGVDAYADHHDLREYKTALRRLGLGGRYALLVMRFNEALDLFDDSSLDFVYIDGYAHTGQEGGETIYQWASKVKPGGVISGHDYDPAFPLTIKAVDRFVETSGFDLHVTNADGGYPSWAMVKTAESAVGESSLDLRRAGRRAHTYARLRRIVATPVKRLFGDTAQSHDTSR